jgi:hypothetical protein
VAQFQVTIRYREPMYSMYAGHDKPRVYTAYYEIEAGDRQAAMQAGLSLFQKSSTDSSVRWEREVVDADAKAAPPPESAP